MLQLLPQNFYTTGGLLYKKTGCEEEMVFLEIVLKCHSLLVNKTQQRRGRERRLVRNSFSRRKKVIGFSFAIISAIVVVYLPTMHWSKRWLRIGNAFFDNSIMVPFVVGQ